jgi:hypothetical protein
MKEFDSSVIDKICYCVYALIDSRDNKPFYVGKGVGNRVFNHAQAAIETNDQSEKLGKVREIITEGHEIDHVILRHSLDKKTALIVESAVLDFASHFQLELTDLVSGHHSSTFGVMSCDEVQRKYLAPPLQELGNDCVIININKKYKNAKQAKSFYEVTRYAWAMKNPIERGIKYVLSEYQGFIVEVFEVTRWYIDVVDGRTRWAFDGHVAQRTPFHMCFNHQKQRSRTKPRAPT